jgi:hypothetical protein
MAVLCLLTNTPWPWPTPAEAASARGGFPTLGTEWRGRSEAEVCTSEARKIRVPLACARGGASQEGLVSLLGAERMRSHFVVAVAMGVGVAGRNEAVTKLRSGDRRGGTSFLSLAPQDSRLRISGCVRSRAMKRLREFDRAEHVCDAL